MSFELNFILSTQEDRPFMDRVRDWDWSMDPIAEWFAETVDFHMETLGYVAGTALVVSAIIFVLMHLDWTKHATGYFMGQITSAAVKSISSLFTVGFGLLLYWLKNQVVARTRNLFRTIRNLFK